MPAQSLYQKLDSIEARYNELTAEISSPEILGDSARFQKLAKTHADLAEVVNKFREAKQIEQGLREAKQNGHGIRRRRNSPDGARRRERTRDETSAD